MSEPLTRGEFITTMNEFGGRIDRLTTQVEKTNGRVSGLEIEQARLHERMQNVKQDIEAQKEQQPSQPVVSDSARALTRWDLAVFLGAAYFLIELGPKLASLIGGPK